MTTNKSKGILKRVSEFKLNNPTYGDHGGGTQEPEFRDSKGQKVPYEKTKWYQLKKQNDEKKSANRRC